MDVTTVLKQNFKKEDDSVFLHTGLLLFEPVYSYALRPIVLNLSVMIAGDTS